MSLERLERESHPLAPKFGELGLVQPAQVRVAELDRSQADESAVS